MPTPDELRELLLDPEETAAMDVTGGTTDAAVLIPLYLDGGDLSPWCFICFEIDELE